MIRSKMLGALVVAILIFTAPGWATVKIPPIRKNNGQPKSSALDDYLKRVRGMNLPSPTTTGSLWVESGAFAALAADYKAHSAGDMLIIHLTDNFTAATNGENKQSRQFNTNSSLTGLLGTIGAKNRLQNLFAGNSATNLDGKGASTMSSNVSLNLAAQVIEVLPNGVLVVQAARDITVGNDRQTVMIRGLVRPGDILPNNSIASTSIADLEVEIKGKGAVADITRQPNIVIRILLKLLSF